MILLIIGVALSQWGIGYNLFYYKHALIASFWIAVGQWLKEHNAIYEKVINKSIYVYPLVAVATFFKCPSYTASIGISMLTIPLHIIYAFVGTMFLLKICSLIKSNKGIEYWGRNSLVVYTLHFIPLLYYTIFLWERFQPSIIWTFLLYLFVLYVLEYGTCWLLMRIFNVKPFKYLAGNF